MMLMLLFHSFSFAGHRELTARRSFTFAAMSFLPETLSYLPYFWGSAFDDSVYNAPGVFLRSPDGHMGGGYGPPQQQRAAPQGGGYQQQAVGGRGPMGGGGGGGGGYG